MRIEKIVEHKKKFLDLLLLADEQEDMIERYLERGDMFALYDEDLKSICVVAQEEDGVYELKNIATYEKFHGQGYGGRLIEYLFDYYKDVCRVMYVGTGDSPRVLRFYHRCGFVDSHKVANFFIDNYDEPIIDEGIQLVDMVYLKHEFE